MICLYYSFFFSILKLFKQLEKNLTQRRWTKEIYMFCNNYKSRYMTWEADMLPQKLNTAAETTTAVVLPAAEMMEPIDEERINWAKKTMLDTRATSVPRPRTVVEDWRVPLASSENLTRKKKIKPIKIASSQSVGSRVLKKQIEETVFRFAQANWPRTSSLSLASDGIGELERIECNNLVQIALVRFDRLIDLFI